MAEAKAEPTGEVDAQGTTGSVEQVADSGMDRFSCRKCRMVLFRGSDLATHEVAAQQFSYRRRVKTRRQTKPVVVPEPDEVTLDDPKASRVTVTCDSYFLEEVLPWMGMIEGRLCCPKCKSRVGVLKWAGSQCSCGTWVTPGIQILKSRVDRRPAAGASVAPITRPTAAVVAAAAASQASSAVVPPPEAAVSAPAGSTPTSAPTASAPTSPTTVSAPAVDPDDAGTGASAPSSAPVDAADSVSNGVSSARVAAGAEEGESKGDEGCDR